MARCSSATDCHEPAAGSLVCFVVAVRSKGARQERSEPNLEKWKYHGKIGRNDCDEGLSGPPCSC